VASSTDGNTLAAVVDGGYIYTSTVSGERYRTLCLVVVLVIESFRHIVPAVVASLEMTAAFLFT